MKKFFKLAILAVVVFASCAKNELQVAKPNNMVEVSFGASVDAPSTKVTLLPNEDETRFLSDWEIGDKIKLQYLVDLSLGEVESTWNGQSFSASLPNVTGEWCYEAYYNGSTNLGHNRTQIGNSYNSNYDVAYGDLIFAGKTEPGKDDNGNPIDFQMDRLTAIAYFHLKSNLNEKVLSATLSVDETGGSTAIAASSFQILDGAISVADGSDLYSITINFEAGQEPNAKDFKLWYNLIPSLYSSMTLEVVTENHKMTLSKSSEGEYVANNLYKVSKTIDDAKWINEEIIKINPLNNIFWNVTQTGANSVSENALTMSGSQEGVDIEMKNGTSTNSYINDVQTRVYNGYTLRFSSLYTITKIAFTADGNNWIGEHVASTGNITDKVWIGSSNDVTISFVGTCRITDVSITVLRPYGLKPELKTLKTPSFAPVAATSETLIFQWGAVANAIGYQVSTDGGNSWSATQTGTSYTWTGLEANTAYTLNVKAIGDGTTYADSGIAECIGRTLSASSGSVTASMTSFSAISGNVGGDANVTYTAAKGGGTSAPAVNNNEIRLYQNSNGTGGGYITIEAKNGTKIKSITIGSSMATSVAYSEGSATATKSATSSITANGTYTYTASGDVTIVTFHCMGKDKESRLYVNKLEVTYE